MKKVEKLLSEGKSPKEIIEMGFAHSTVYAVAKKVRSKTAKKDFEVELGIYDLIQQMAQWIELLAFDSGFSDGTKLVPCLHCANKGEADFMMKINKKEDRFECPRCGSYLLDGGHLSVLSTIYLVQQRIKRGEKPPEVA
jgi:DNA-directed RNA polymerase subunit RPC12/RpoP